MRSSCCRALRHHLLAGRSAKKSPDFGLSVQLHGRWSSPVLDLNDFFYFVQVVDRGGFTAAGRTLRQPKSTLSHRIQQLEAELGARLLNRTSRRFGMTDAGQDFYRHAVAMLREA